MTDFEIPLAEPFTATERGLYEPAWRDGAWTVEPSRDEWGGFELRPGDTVTSLRVEDPPLIVQRDPGQEPDGQLLLGLPVRESLHNAPGARTVREYLIQLLGVAMTLKSPWGDSGWDIDLYQAFERGGFLEIEYFDDGYYVKDYDRDRAGELARAAIAALGATDGPGPHSAGVDE